MNGALLVHKHQGVSSFGIIELLQRQWMEKQGVRKRDLPKIGHGGTLDPFATGLLIVLMGRGVKLARYFLGSTKGYEGLIRFGETTIPGDPTAPISEKCQHVPESLEELRSVAHSLTLQPYDQLPPMHSAKKKNGKPLYELAREGIEIERETKTCYLYDFTIQSYNPPQAAFSLKCSSGTYVRTLSQDYAKKMGSLALLDTLHRNSSGVFKVEDAWTVQQIAETSSKKWSDLPCWVPFDQLLDGFYCAEATAAERLALFQGRQSVLTQIVQRLQPPRRKLNVELTQEQRAAQEECAAIYCSGLLIAVARKQNALWEIERVFTEEFGI